MLFCANGYIHPMSLYDPLAKLAVLGATAHTGHRNDGAPYIYLTWRRDSGYVNQRKGEAIRKRFERLLLIQLDVQPGHRPRTVQQLVASGRLLVVNGRYVERDKYKRTDE